MPNERWDDFTLDREFQTIGQRMEMYEHSIEGLSHFPIDVAKAALQIEHLAEEVQSVRMSVTQVGKQCEQIREDWQEALAARQKGRTAIVVAVVTGCFTVLAAMVVLIGSLVGG